MVMPTLRNIVLTAILLSVSGWVLPQNNLTYGNAGVIAFNDQGGGGTGGEMQ